LGIFRRDRQKRLMYNLKPFDLNKPIVFLRKSFYPAFMNKNYLYVMMPFLLTGCIGSLIEGHTEYVNDCFPNILTVPEREEATRPRGLHKGDEKESRSREFKTLEQAREEIRARDEALREGRFPESESEDKEKKLTSDDTGDSLESVELDRAVP